MSDVLLTTAPMWGENIRVLDIVAGEGFSRSLARLKPGAEGMKPADIMRDMDKYVEIIQSEFNDAVSTAKSDLAERAKKCGATGVMACSLSVQKDMMKPYGIGNIYLVKQMAEYPTYFVMISGTAVTWESPST